MAKKSNAKSNNVFPLSKTIDELAVLGDDELYAHLDYLFSALKGLRSTQDTALWEKEISYAQRELQIRASRRKAADSVQSLESESSSYFQEDEDSYPEVADNIEFVNLAKRIEATRERARNRERRAAGNNLA